MKKRMRIQPGSVLVGLLGALVLIGLVGASSAETTRDTALDTTRPVLTAEIGTRAALPAGDIVSVGGRKSGANAPGSSIYTVPGGKTLIIHSIEIRGFNKTTAVSIVAGFNLYCGPTLLIPREVLSAGVFSFGGFAGEIGPVCPAGSSITLGGPPIGGTFPPDSIGWLMLGELQ